MSAYLLYFQLPRRRWRWCNAK